MAAPRRAARPKSQLPECYYEGYLEKRSFKDKLARKLWTSLCGNSLFFFNNSKDNSYVEKLDLAEFVSLSDDSSLDRNLEAARLLLKLKNASVHLTAPSLEARELWKGYIFSVAELSVPASLNLLPGQVVMMKEIVEKEKQRRKPQPADDMNAQPIYLGILGDMPACYHKVTRVEAELLLERNADKGNLLLRSGQDGASFAVSTRQELARPLCRHYRVTRRPEGGFTIAVDNPIHCETLHDVVNYMVEKTSGIMKPLALEQAYEKSITFVQPNEENGENTEQCASRSPVPPLLPLKPAPRAASPESDPEESIYLNDSDEEDGIVDGLPPVVPRGPVCPLPSSATDPKKDVNKKVLLPPNRPIAAPRSRTISERDTLPRTAPRGPMLALDARSQTFSEELKEKLLRRQANVE